MRSPGLCLYGDSRIFHSIGHDVPTTSRGSVPGVRGITLRLRAAAVHRAFWATLLLSVTSFAALDAQVNAIVQVRVRSDGRVGGVAGAQVGIEGSGVAAVTDGTGRALLRSLPPGRHRLSVRAFGFAEVVREVVAENGRVTAIDVVLSPNPVRLEALDVLVPASRLPGGGVSIETANLPATIGDLPSLLESLPGVTVVRRGAPGSAAGIQIRGSDTDQVLVLLDGVPLQSALSGEADLSTVDLTGLARVVVLPGARSARYGARALGGVVLLESGPPGSTGIGGSAGTGSWGLRDGALRAAWSSPAGWAATFGGQTSRGVGDFAYAVPAFRGGGRALRDNASHASDAAQLRIERRTGRSRVSIGLHTNRLDRGSAGPTAQPSQTGEQEHRRTGSRVQVELGDDGMGARASASTQKQRASYRDPAPPFGAAFDHSARADRGDVSAESWWSHSRLGVRAGFMVARQTIDATPIPNLLSVAERAVWGRIDAAHSFPWSDAGARIGLRLDQHDLVENLTVSPALEVDLVRGASRLDISLRRAFAPPGPSDLFFQEGVLVRPNPDLRPERIDAEVVVAGSRRGRAGAIDLEVRAEVFRADVTDQILWFPDFQFIWSPANFDVRRDGMEAGLSVSLPILGHLHFVSAQASLTRVEYAGEALSGQVAYRPRMTADLAVRGPVRAGEWSLQARTIGERRSVPGTALNSLPGYTTLDVGLSWPVAFQRLHGRIDVAVSNLFDTPAGLLADYPLPGRGWTLRVHLDPRSSS